MTNQVPKCADDSFLASFAETTLSFLDTPLLQRFNCFKVFSVRFKKFISDICAIR